MGEARIFSCDVCGVPRKQVNHWFLVTGDKAAFRSESFNEITWDVMEPYANAQGQYRAVACGELHAIELYSRWLVNRTFEARERGFEERGTVSGRAATEKS